MMSWINKFFPLKIKKINKKNKNEITKKILVKCSSCNMMLCHKNIEKNLYVCYKCNYHMIIKARYRISNLLDNTGRYEIGENIIPIDLLKFKDNKKYIDRLKEAQIQTGEKDSLIVIGGTIYNLPVVVACFEFNFISGSMGSVAGERFVQGVQNAIKNQASFICFSSSGGVRIQEGLFSLMQMAKTTAILTKLAEKKLPFISVLTNPTIGGVSASFAFLGDIIIAEPRALIGFFGFSIFEKNILENLSENFQKSEFLLKHGAIDMIIDRRNIREKLANLISILTNKSILSYKDII